MRGTVVPLSLLGNLPALNSMVSDSLCSVPLVRKRVPCLGGHSVIDYDAGDCIYGYRERGYYAVVQVGED